MYSDCFTYIYYVYKINEVLVTRIYFTSTIQSLFGSKVRCSDLWTRKIRKNEDFPNTKKFQPFSINLRYYNSAMIHRNDIKFKIFICIIF